MDHYNVDELNGDSEVTQIESCGGSPERLLPGLAESLKKMCSQPEIVIKRIIKNNGTYCVGNNLCINAWYPGNDNQSLFVSVESFCDEHNIDYYQLPYSHVIPRIKTLFDQNNEDSSWFIAQINNGQLECWLEDEGVMKMSADALRRLPESNNETIRNKHRDILERGQEQTDD